jgi:O-antigen biosynthesis protein
VWSDALSTGRRSSRAHRGIDDGTLRARIYGWVWEPDCTDLLALQTLDNGAPIARALANAYREDLERAGIGTGRHSFDLLIPGGLLPLARHMIEVRRDGA